MAMSEHDLEYSFMLSALCHDLGKATTTLEDLTSSGHDAAGVEPTLRLCEKLMVSAAVAEHASELVGAHMTPFELNRTRASIHAYRRLHRRVSGDLDGLARLSRADSAGRTGRSLADPHAPSARLLEMATVLDHEDPRPLVMGRDILAMGLKPGPKVGALLREAMEMQLDGATREEILARLGGLV